VVRHKLWERATSCYLPLCYRLDPILYAFYNIPHNERGNYIGQLITSSSWTAENQGDGTWLVTATHQDGNSYTFEANSIYQIICSEHTPVCR
jgi:hypothetical protein